MGKRGFFTGFAEPVCGPAYSCFFMPNNKAMSINITNLGGTVNYHDNHKELTINNANNVSSLVRSFFAEDITPSEDFSSVSPESDSGKGLFCRITKAAYEKGVAQQVDDDLRSACVSAPKLVKALNTNDALGYTDTKNLNSIDLYDMLNEHYGLPFKPRAFQTARSK